MLHHRTKMTKNNIECKTRRKMEMLELRDGYTYTSIEAHTVHAVSRSSGEISSVSQATFSQFQYVPPLESIQHQNTSLMVVQESRILANTTSKRINEIENPEVREYDMHTCSTGSIKQAVGIYQGKHATCPLYWIFHKIS